MVVKHVVRGALAAIATHPKPGAAMVLHESAELRPGTGVVGDVPGRATGREVTVVDFAAWQRTCAELRQEVSWTVRRSNLLVTGLDLSHSSGSELCIGGVRLRITGETKPCRIMERQCEGLQRALEPEWRGGATCTVVAGGQIKVGATVELLPAE